MVWDTRIESEDEFGKVSFYENPDAGSFLNDSKSHRFFICGLKGVGKTLLLRHKSAALRRSAQGTIFVPETELSETLTALSCSFDDAKVTRLSTFTAWHTIWKSVILTVILKRTKQKYNQDVDAIFKNLERSTSIGDHISCLLGYQKIEQVLRNLEILNMSLSASSALVQSAVCLFIDSIDEMVVVHSGAYLGQYKQRKITRYGNLSLDVWNSAQVGFMTAALDIYENNKHLKVYGALRYEALESDPLPHVQNIRPHVLCINYSKEDLRNIFRKKLEALHELERDAFCGDDDDIIGKFFGTKSIYHQSVKDADRSPHREDILNYVIRHTRGRPRELDEIGRGIQAISAKERTVEAIRERVRIRSGEFFQWAQDEAIPYWDDHLTAIVNSFTSNILSREEIEKILENLYKIGEVDSIESGWTGIEELFSYGLIGCACKIYGKDDDLYFKFRQFDPLNPVDLDVFRSSKWFAIHPCVNVGAFKNHSAYKPNPWSISGHGERFVTDREFGHLHIGAGAIGLGCVVPLLTSDPGVGVCIFQRYRKGESRWDEMASSDASKVTIKLDIINNREYGESLLKCSEFTLVTDACSEQKVDDLISDWRHGERNLFVLSNEDDEYLLRTIMSNATSLSTAVKGGNLKKVSETISKFARKKVKVYPFENDDDAVKEAKSILGDSGIEVIDVCVDRICQKPEILKKGKEVIWWLIEASVEQYVKVHIFDKTDFTRKLYCPSGSKNQKKVFILDNPDEYEFFKLRKRLLVNARHFFFAIVSKKYIEIYKRSERDALSSALSTTIFARNIDVMDKMKLFDNVLMFTLLVAARKYGLINGDGDFAIIKSSIRSEQQDITDRVSTVPDRLSRILQDDESVFVKKGKSYLKKFSDISKDIKSDEILSRNISDKDVRLIEKDISEINRLYLNSLFNVGGD